jgi:dynein-related subfamily AAA family protein
MSLSELIDRVAPGAPSGAGARPAVQLSEHWLPAPSDPNATIVASGSSVLCPRVGDGVHEARLVPGAHMTDVTLVSLLIQAGWPIRLYGPAGYGKTSLAEAAMVAALPAIDPDGKSEVVVFNGSTGVRDEAVVGRPTQDADGRWIFVPAKFAVAVKAGNGLVVNEADLLGYTLKALNAPMERAPLSLDAYEPGQPDIAVHKNFRAIFTDNNDPQFPLEASVRSRLKLELAVCDPGALHATAVPATDLAGLSAAPALGASAYETVAIPEYLNHGVPLPANPLAIALVTLLARIGRLDNGTVPAELEGELNALGLDPREALDRIVGAESWTPGRREIIAITQAEQIVGTEIGLRAFLTKCSLVGVSSLAQLLISRIWQAPAASAAFLDPLTL